MDKFIEWLMDKDTPHWLIFPFVVVVVCCCLVFAAINITLLSIGLWPVVIIIWLIIPAYVLYHEYSKHNERNK